MKERIRKMSDMMEEKDKVLSFTMIKIEKGREKICRCSPPHYEIDPVNRVVSCMDCGATLDAFDALLTLCEYMEKFEEYQKEAIKKAETYREWAEKEWRRRMKNRAFKEMDSYYHKGMLPCCPKCRNLFNPMEITEWANEKYYSEKTEEPE